MIDLQGDDGLFVRLGELLTDEGLDFWTKAYQAKSVNEAAKAIIKLKPEANYKRFAFSCDAGKSLQSLPGDAFKLLDVEGVVDADGHVCCAIKPNSVNELNRQEPGWRKAELSESIEFFLYEDIKPREFWLYPRPAAGLRVSLVYSFFPPVVTKNSERLEMLDQYESDIVNYCLWRAWQREGTEQKIMAARQVFHEEMGIADKSDDETHPQDNRRRDERNRARRG